MPSPPFGVALQQQQQHNINNNSSNAINSLTEVLHLLNKRRVETLQSLQTEHDSTARWLKDSIQSYKRKLGKEADSSSTITSVTTGNTLSINVVANKKIKTDIPANSNLNAFNKINTSANANANGNPASQGPLANGASSIFKETKHSTHRPPQKYDQQMQQAKINLNSSIKSSQLVVPVYHDEFSAHPRYLSIMSMKVQELRKELRTLDLETGGLKKELQKRLLEALQVTSTRGEETAARALTVDLIDDPIADESQGHDKQSASGRRIVNDRMSCESIHSARDEHRMSIEIITQNQPQSTVAALIAATEEKAKPLVSDKKIVPTVSQSFVKSTATLFSPNRITSKFQQPRPHEINLPTKPLKAMSPFASIKQSIVNTAASLLSAKKSDTVSVFPLASKQELKDQVEVEERRAEEEVNVDKIPTPIAESQTDSIMPVIETPNMAKISDEPAKEMPATASLSSVVKDKQKLLAEARKQRLAELRGKSKPLCTVVASSTTNHLIKSTNNTHPGLVKQLSSSSTKLLPTNPKEDNKRTLITAKMREKHAALKTTKNPFQPSTVENIVPAKFAQNGNDGPAKAATAPMYEVPAWRAPLEKVSSPNELSTSANDLPPMSPLDTYQISDREQSDSDDESDDSDAGPKKKIPEWAQKENLITALKQQYDENGNRLDPDALFPEVETCDLEAIFDKKRNRFKTRTSSGNWTKDRVTVAEKLVYKRAMGFSTKPT